MGDYNYYDTYGYDSYGGGSGDPAAALAAILMFSVVYLFVMLIVYVYSAITIGKMFEKAGIEKWKAWIPIYNSWVLYEMGGQKGWWVLVAFLPFVGIVSIVFLIMAIHKINENFGKGVGFTVLAIFLPLVWTSILGFGRDEWNAENDDTYTNVGGGYQQPQSGYSQAHPPQHYGQSVAPQGYQQPSYGQPVSPQQPQAPQQYGQQPYGSQQPPAPPQV